MAKTATIIIKRIVKGGHGGGHGGAWKVAYADFVTAMMCFFLVMWLMGSDEETKAAISSYFNNPNPASPWRPELKDNENIPLGNRTGSGDSLLKGSDVSEQMVKEPVPVVYNDAKSKDANRVLTEEAIGAADTITFSVSEDELFANHGTDILNEEKAARLLSIVGKIAILFKGSLKIRGILDSNPDENFELRVARLVAVQRFIIDRQWMAEESIKTSFRKTNPSTDVDYSESGRKIELVFVR